MEEDSSNLPLRRRVPGAAHAAPGVSTQPVLPQSVLLRMQAAVDAARAQAPEQDREPTTEPIPRVTAAAASTDAPGSTANGGKVRQDRGAKSKRPSKRHRAAIAAGGAKLGRSAPNAAAPATPTMPAAEAPSSAPPKPAALPKRETGPQPEPLPKRGAQAQPDSLFKPETGPQPEPVPKRETAPQPEALPRRDAPDRSVTPPAPAAQAQAPAEQTRPPATQAEQTAEAGTTVAAGRAAPAKHSGQAPPPGQVQSDGQARPSSQPLPAASSRPAAHARPSAPPEESSQSVPRTESAEPPERTVPTPAHPSQARPAQARADRARATRAHPAPDRRPAQSPRMRPEGQARRRFGAARLAAAAIVIVAAGAVAVALSLGTTPTATTPKVSSLERQEAANRVQAAAWVSQQVSRTAVVACDQLMCSALVSHGFPQGKVRVLGSTTPYPLSSQLVVETASVRGLYGSSFSSDYASTVIAAFGSGEAQISIRMIAPHGAAAYQRALNADVRSRQQTGAELLGSNQITTSAAAKFEMGSGNVDTRLLVAIFAVASVHPIDIVAFGNLAEGASPGVPLRYADLAENDKAAHMSAAAYVRSMLSTLTSVPAQYRPMRTETVKLSGGLVVLRIEFSAPSPLGVLAPKG